MKMLPIYLVALLAFAGCNHEASTTVASHTQRLTEEAPDLHRVKGQMTFQGAPFTGWIEARYPDGSLRSETPYVEGWKEGTACTWYPNGHLESKRIYATGKKVGTHEGWFAEGQKRFSYQFVAGRHEGEMREWYANGTPLSIMHHVAGQESGRQQVWHADGRIKSNYVVKAGRRYGLVGTNSCTTVAEVL